MEVDNSRNTRENMISPQDIIETRKIYPSKPSTPAPDFSEVVSQSSNHSLLLGKHGPSEISKDITDNHDMDTCSTDLLREEERLKTFEKWPLAFLEPKVLARNGFYYLGRGDEVRCAFCRVEIMKWEEGDDPAEDHQRWAPQCPFLKQHPSAGNVPIESTSSGRDECGTRQASTVPSALRIPRPVHLQYSNEAARLNSFKDWPRSMRQKPEELAAAGFFYTGHGDKTKCFYCDGGLKDWEDDDVPWEEHARWFDRCAYLILVKGKEYIQKVKTEACLIRAPKAPKEETNTTGPSPVKIPPQQSEEVPIAESKLCKICYDEEHNIVFVPCGHVVACAKCALSTESCPMCRRPIENVVRIYFS